MSLFHAGLILVPFWLEYLMQIPFLELLFFSFSIIFSSKLNFCLWNLPTTSGRRILSRYSHEFHLFSSSSDSAYSSTSTKCYPGTCRGPSTTLQLQATGGVISKLARGTFGFTDIFKVTSVTFTGLPAYCTASASPMCDLSFAPTLNCSLK